MPDTAVQFLKRINVFVNIQDENLTTLYCQLARFMLASVNLIIEREKNLNLNTSKVLLFFLKLYVLGFSLMLIFYFIYSNIVDPRRSYACFN